MKRVKELFHWRAIASLAKHKESAGLLVVHLVPLSAFGVRDQVDVEKASSLSNGLRPIDAQGWTPRINFDGFINVRGGDECHGYTQLFRNGIIEATKVGVTSAFKEVFFIPAVLFEQRIIEAVPAYMDALQRLEVPTPVVLLISVLATRKAMLGVGGSGRELEDSQPIDRDALLLPEITFEQYGDKADYQRGMRPAFDAFWNAGGFTKSLSFNDNGEWIGANRRP